MQLLPANFMGMTGLLRFKDLVVGFFHQWQPTHHVSLSCHFLFVLIVMS